MSSSDSPAKKIIVFFELSYYNGAVVYRINDSQDPLTNGFGTFLSVPGLKISMPPYSGTFDAREIEVEIPFEANPVAFAAIVSSRAFSEVYSRAWQYIEDESSSTFRQLYSGRMSASVKNPGGREGLIKLKLITAKSELKRGAGIVSADTCAWTFGDPKTCTIDTAALTEVANMTSVSRNVVTISGLGSHRDRYWNKGVVKANGISITIKEWVSGTSFKLAKLIPLQWEESIISSGIKVVSVVPGCDQLKETCGLWSNLPNILPVGVATPKYNPFFENSG